MIQMRTCAPAPPLSNAIERPSGDHEGEPGHWRASWVSWRAFDPSAAATQI
jgi:hypothetical protein